MSHISARLVSGLASVIAIFLSPDVGAAGSGGFQSLFNGTDLSGWKTVPPRSAKTVDEIAYDALGEVIDHGAYLFNNGGDCAGCYRVYEAGLIAMRPFLTDRPEVQKRIDDGIEHARRHGRIIEQAFALRHVLEDLRSAVKQGKRTDKDKTFIVRDGIIVVTGKPNGYFYTDKSYKNYILQFDWRYKKPANLTDDSKFNGNSGLLVHIQPPQKVWPKCVEVQGMNKAHGQIFAIGGAKGKFSFDAKALQAARKPVGEWNTTEVVCKDGEITSKVNGAQVSTGKGELTEGPFGFQSEGAEIHFKNIKIKVLK